MPPAVDERNTLIILEGDFPVNGLLGNITQNFTLQKRAVNK